MKLKNNVKSFLISIIVGASISFSFYFICSACNVTEIHVTTNIYDWYVED